MSVQQREVRSEDVGELYDQITELPVEMLGDNHHFGYFHEGVPGQTMQEAADRLTDMLIDRMKLSPGRRVLDVGCGTGRPAVRVAQTADVDVVGITVSRRQLEISQERAQREGITDRVTFQYANAMALPFEPGSFDAALAIESLVHMPDHAHVLRQIAQVLRPGGLLVGAHPVLRSAGAEDDSSFLQQFYELFEITEQPALEDYPRFLAQAGLRLTYMEDLYSRIMPPSLEAMRDWVASHSDELNRAGMPNDLVDQMTASMQRFADLPNVGFALFTAQRI